MKAKPYVFGHLVLLDVSSFSFEMKPTSFQTKVFSNDTYVFPDEGLLKRRLSPRFLGV
jgi:hypothetical protein